MRTRFEEDMAKNAQDMPVRLFNSSCPMLQVICCNGEELSQKVEKRNFANVMMKDLLEENFVNIIANLQIRGLRKALGIIEPLIPNMDRTLGTAKKRNQDVKERKLGNIWKQRNTKHF